MGRLPVMASPISFCAQPGWSTVWSDHFSSPTLDATKWNVPVSNAASHRTLGADCRGRDCIPLGSCRDASCTREDVYIEGGQLTMRSRRTAPGAWATGAVNTWGKAAWRANESSGPFRACVNAVLPGDSVNASRSAGLWPAHWLMPHDDACDPDEGEMDIMEMVDGSGDWAATYHWQTTYPTTNCSYPHGHLSESSSLPLGSQWNSTVHEFAVERGASHVAFVLDGVVALNVSANDANASAPLFWDVPWYFILNTAVGGGWPGSATPATTFPAYHRVDSVVVARRSPQERT